MNNLGFDSYRESFSVMPSQPVPGYAAYSGRWAGFRHTVYLSLTPGSKKLPLKLPRPTGAYATRRWADLRMNSSTRRSWSTPT